MVEAQLTNLVKIYLIFSGLWPKISTKYIFVNKLYSFYSIFMKTSITTLYVSLVIELVRLIWKSYEFAIIVSSLGIIINCIRTSVKIVLYLRNNIFELLNEIIEKEMEVKSKYGDEVYNLYLRSIRSSKLFGKLLGISSLIAMMGTYITGAYKISQQAKYNRANNSSLEGHLMLQIWFPVNILEHLGWAWGVETILFYDIYFYSVTSHLVMITYFTYPAVHLKILQHRLRTYITDYVLHDHEMDKMILVLKEIIREHDYLIKFTNHLNKFCKHIILMEFLIGSFSLAFIAVNVLKVKQEEMPFLAIYLCSLIFQLFCVAWTSNEISFQSQAIAVAAYEGKWYLLNKEGRQVTNILIARAQKPVNITIGPFSPMTTGAFVTVLKAAYSYVSLMME